MRGIHLSIRMFIIHKEEFQVIVKEQKERQSILNDAIAQISDEVFRMKEYFQSNSVNLISLI